MTRTVVVVSDLHVGSTVGILPDGVHIYDDLKVRPSRAQRWLKSVWDKDWETVKEIAGNDEITIIFNGDLIDGHHHGTLQLITDDETLQVQMANDLLEPVVELAKNTVFVRGTPSHVGQDGRFDEMVARNFDGLTLGTSFHSHFHVKLRVEGVRFDVSHFSTQSGIFRNSGNAINQLATEVMMSYYENGEKPPNYAIRSHRHVYRSSGDNFTTEAIQTPAFQLSTHYVRSGRNPNSLADIGLIVFKIDGKKSTKTVLKDRPSSIRSRKTWTI